MQEIERQFDEQEKLLLNCLAEMEHIETLYSENNYWIKLFADASIPQTLGFADVKRWLVQVQCFRFERVTITVRGQEWRDELSQECFKAKGKE